MQSWGGKNCPLSVSFIFYTLEYNKKLYNLYQIFKLFRSNLSVQKVTTDSTMSLFFQLNKMEKLCVKNYVHPRYFHKI